MLRLIRQDEMVEGPWRNGMGVSWEIASHQEAGAADFSWRFAKARIDRDVPFSIYPGIDRVFKLWGVEPIYSLAMVWIWNLRAARLWRFMKVLCRMPLPAMCR